MKKIYMMMAGMMLAMSATTADAITTLYVCGAEVNGSQNWNPKNPVAVTATDGFFTFKAKGEFKMSSAKGDWDAAGGFNSGGKRVSSWKVSGNTATGTMVTTNLFNNSDSPTEAASKVVTYKVNEAFTTISAEWEGGTVEETFYIHGQNFGGWDSWEDAYKMTPKGDNIYEYVAEDGLKTGGWKISTKDYVINFGKGEKQPEVGKLYNLVQGGMDNNINIATTGKTTIRFAYVPGGTSTLLITGEETREPAPEQLFFRGHLEDGDAWGSSVKMTKIDNTFSYTFTGKRVEDNYVTFTTAAYGTGNNGWELPAGAVRYGTGAGNVEVTVNKEYDMIAGDNDGCWQLPAGTYTAKATFDEATGKGKVVFANETQDGVEAIEAVAGEVAYYNLQGIRVMQPKHGVYVKVANGKATKVMM